jgi:hypothetical protein
MISELGQRGFLCNASLWSASRLAVQRGAPTAAQEKALMTPDVLDRLLVICSPDRLADICDRAVCLSAHRPDIADFIVPRHPA